MRKFFLVVTLLSLSVSTGAIAQPQQQRSGTPEEQKACARDVQNFCRPVMDQGDLTVLACLQQNRPKIDQGLRSGSERPRAISALQPAAAEACYRPRSGRGTEFARDRG